jgi:dipeptidyl aminopeptidase/acylaminoacyl peptidase
MLVGAEVWLPTTYEEGKKYPVIVVVYPGSNPPQGEDRVSKVTDEQDPLAHGYVELYPSMPNFGMGVFDNVESMTGTSRDPLMEVTNGVLPAVDKLVDLGIADSNRIGVEGHSYGGFAVYGLITQTSRFKAAIAYAGLSDLVSLYLSFSRPEARYTPYAAEDLFPMDFLENPFGFWNPPWKDLGRYLRNSPINYVDRVKTPVMIVQGDMDFVPIAQGEEFFKALQRQNKRVEFVRYWGEGHVIRSPANVRDEAQRTLAWWDQYLKSPNATSPVSSLSRNDSQH